ncbi:hypothetical protein CDAR_571851 [Caerostris darwini]|uniref:Uncharacterized protein n=1 Tax=Caerostris darwini TaxID=1538125 RepID=A0AAV4PMT0_9ARAC|nr:hypothetical protein CDAR_571851 [Caerostris darwini]
MEQEVALFFEFPVGPPKINFFSASHCSRPSAPPSIKGWSKSKDDFSWKNYKASALKVEQIFLSSNRFRLQCRSKTLVAPRGVTAFKQLKLRQKFGRRRKARHVTHPSVSLRSKVKGEPDTFQMRKSFRPTIKYPGGPVHFFMFEENFESRVKGKWGS